MFLADDVKTTGAARAAAAGRCRGTWSLGAVVLLSRARVRRAGGRRRSLGTTGGDVDADDGTASRTSPAGASARPVDGRRRRSRAPRRRTATGGTSFVAADGVVARAGLTLASGRCCRDQRGHRVRTRCRRRNRLRVRLDDGLRRHEARRLASALVTVGPSGTDAVAGGTLRARLIRAPRLVGSARGAGHDGVGRGRWSGSGTGVERDVARSREPCAHRTTTRLPADAVVMARLTGALERSIRT